MRYYLIAGERSGDLHAGNLAKALLKHDDKATMRGFGGDYMKSAGVEIAIHYNEVAIMGFWEVVANLQKIARYLRRCKEDIVKFNPDVLILVDYGGFNKKIAAWAKQQNIRVYYYISPKVWAWNQKRAWKLKATVDKMFVILPFEKDFYKKFEWEVDYVGNPVLDAVKSHVGVERFREKNNIRKDRPLVALLPGSRKQELQYVIPLMAEIAKRFSDVQFAFAGIRDLPDELYGPFKNLSNVVPVLEDTYNLLQNSEAAIVTSGTATLETALFGIPQIVVYKTSSVSYWIAKHFIQVPYISLVNLIANKEVVKELIQNDLTVENLALELSAILNTSRGSEIKKEYGAIFTKLDIGSASENAASLMYRYLVGHDSTL